MFIAHDETDKQVKALLISRIIGKLWSLQREIVQFEDQEWINEALPLQLKLISDGLNSNDYFSSEIMIEKRMDAMRKEQSFIEFNLNDFSYRRSDTNWIDIAQSKGIASDAVNFNIVGKFTLFLQGSICWQY